MSASLAMIAWPAAACAATVKLSGTSLVYEAAPGEINDFEISKARLDKFTVSDRTAAITPLAGCSLRSPHTSPAEVTASR